MMIFSHLSVALEVWLEDQDSSGRRKLSLRVDFDELWPRMYD